MQRLPRLRELPTAASASPSAAAASSSPSLLLPTAPVETHAAPLPLQQPYHQQPYQQQQQHQPPYLPPQQPQVSSFAEMPAFLASMVDFNGQSAVDGFLPFADYQQQPQPAPPPQNHPFATSLNPWDPFPGSVAFAFDATSASSDFEQEQQEQFARRPSFSAFMRRHGEPRFHPSAGSRIAAVQALGLFLPPTRAAPQQIDLTLSSSESDSDGDLDPGSYRHVGSSASNSSSTYGAGDTHDEGGGDDDDDEVEILQTRVPARAASPAARYLTYASVPPLRRKRRRVESAAAAVKDDPVDLERFDGKRAESTTISMMNNETIERFKAALKCSICLDVLEEMTSTRCGHVYCAKCIRAAIRVTAKCPLCQRRLRPKDTHPLYF